MIVHTDIETHRDIYSHTYILIAPHLQLLHYNTQQERALRKRAVISDAGARNRDARSRDP